MKDCFLVIIFISLSFSIGWGQTSTLDSLLDDISFFADAMVNADDAEHRIRAHDAFLESLNSLIEKPGSYDISLDSIRWISVLHGDQFRIVTWQLRKSDEEYKYGGFIQWPDRIVHLNDSRPWLNGSSFNTYTAGLWYGALYYKIIPFESSGQRYYVLFGFNAEDLLLNTKVADVLDLTGPEPRFGVAVFIGNGEPRTRLILTYADVSSVHLRDDQQLNAIVHDHLENLIGVGPAGEALPVSDGSLEGWLLKNGKWVYEEEVYDEKMDEPPMTDERKDRKEDKDLFGRPKKEK